MIIGFGSDLVDIRRIEKLHVQYGETFLNKIFTPNEQAKAQSRAKVAHGLASTLAKRFAAKEACVKALGKEGVSWLDMEISNDASGEPKLILSGKAAELLKARTPQGMQSQAHVSLSDEYPYAQAMVIIHSTDKVAG